LKLSSKLVIIYIPLEWNDYSIGIVILMFGRDLFLGIVIPIGIHILLRRGIDIPLKNERNSYSNGNRIYLPKKTLLFFIFFQFFFPKKKEKNETPPPFNCGGWSASHIWLWVWCGDPGGGHPLAISWVT
jgi:hypothetical protein